MELSDIAAHGVPQELLSVWEEAGLSALTECQKAALGRSTIWQGRNAIISAPTSSGKTFVGEVLAAKAGFELKRALFVVPYKALAHEKYVEFRERYEAIGLSVVVSDRDHTEFDSEITQGHFGIAVVVYEKLLNLLIASPGILADCSLVVVDEVQNISDKVRGPALELLLNHVKTIEAGPQIIALSASVSDLGGLDAWLDAEPIVSTERPVPLWEGVATSEGCKRLTNTHTREQRPGVSFGGGESSSDAVDLIGEVIVGDGLTEQYLVFRSRVDDTARTARRLAEMLPAEPVEAEVRATIASLERTALRDYLERWIDRRVAYHNAGLSLEERRVVEDLFREGVIRVLVSTTTLAMGINTPTDVVIMADYRRWDPIQRSNVPIPVAEYRNCVGRAGRLGIAKAGRSYLVTDNPAEARMLERKYIHGVPEVLSSALSNIDDPATFLLRVIGLEGNRTTLELARGLRATFGRFASSDVGANDDDMRDDWSATADRLIELRLVVREEGRVSLTGIGAIVASSGLSVATFATLWSQLEDAVSNGWEDDEWVEVVCSVDEMNGIRPFQERDKEAVLRSWIEGEPIGHIINNYVGDYRPGYGHVRSLGETAAWMLSTVEGICEEREEDERLKAIVSGAKVLNARCALGCVPDAIQLAGSGLMTRDEVQRLVDARGGAKAMTLHGLLECTADDVSGVFSPRRLGEIQEAILALDQAKFERVKAGHLVRASKFPGMRPLVARCYNEAGISLDRAFESLLSFEQLELSVYRFAKQRTGQPDLEIVGKKGTIVIAVTASEEDGKPISWNKARMVTTSVGFSGEASNFIAIGRPVFHDLAVANAEELADRGQKLFLLTVGRLIDECLKVLEGQVTAVQLLEWLEDSVGADT